jgi:hypothetical protein
MHAGLLLLAIVLAGCAAAPPAATRIPGVDPIATQGTVRIAVDDVAPGGEVGWGVFIENTSGSNAVVDGYDLVDLSPGVDILGAAAIPQLPPPGIGPETIVTDDVRSMVASRPLVGSTIGPTTTEFQVKDQAGRVVIAASRAWFSIHDAYGIQIAPGFEVPLGLAIVVALERVEVQEQGNQSPIQNLLGGIGPF